MLTKAKLIDILIQKFRERKKGQKEGKNTSI